MNYCSLRKTISDYASKRVMVTMGKKEENLKRSLQTVKEMLETLNYGSVTLVVQDNYVIQIEKTEKIRLK